jgi:hypothetical protein
MHRGDRRGVTPSDGRVGDALLKKLAKVMLGSDEHFPPPNAPEGLLTRVRIEKVGGLGPWTS